MERQPEKWFIRGFCMSARFGYKNRIRNMKFLNRIHDFGYFARFRYLYPKTGSVRLSELFIRVVFRIQKWWLQDCYIRIVSETIFGFSAKKEERGIREGESMTHNCQKRKQAQWLITTRMTDNCQQYVPCISKIRKVWMNQLTIENITIKKSTKINIID